MKEIIELNKMILIDAPGVVTAAQGFLLVRRNCEGDEGIAKLPPGLKGKLEAICAQLDRLVPNDFNYSLILGDYNPDFRLEFCDGGMMTASCPEPFAPKKSIFKQLEKVDWDKHRSFGMSGSQFFDGLRMLSEITEPKLPLTAHIQQEFRNELEVFAKKQRTGPEKFHLLLWRGDEGVQEQGCATLKDVQGAFVDLMTCGYSIIGVLTDGKLMEPEKIDEIKLEMLQDMKKSMPISYARAVGLA